MKPNETQAMMAKLKEVTKVVLPEPQKDIVPLAKANPLVAQEITKRVNEIDIHDATSIINFGSGAQAELQEISQSMLAGVKNKDVGPAGESLKDMVTTIRGFSLSGVNGGSGRSFLDRILGRMSPIAKFMANYESIQGQIDKLTTDLEQHQHGLLKDIKSLDILYEKTLTFYDELALYISAGEEKVRQIDETTIPEKEEMLKNASPAETVMEAQELRDIRAARDDLERRVHDLKLTRQVTMQSLPSIRLVQENDKSLVTKISSTLVNTVPLWETQLAQAVTIHRSAQAATAVKEATDLTNDLLTSNAKNLRDANVRIRTEMERGVFDIEAIRVANAELIASIEDSLRIADEGKARRVIAEEELKKMEGELRNTLSSASAHKVISNQSDDLSM